MNERYYSLDLDEKLIWNFRDIGHIMRYILEGKGSQKRILLILKETGVITQSELTQMLGIQPGSASEVFGKLENAGLILRSPNNVDRRTTDIQLTEAGKEQVEMITVQRKQRRDAVLSCLSEQEKETLLSLLEKISSDWEKHPHECDERHKDHGPHKGHAHHEGHGHHDHHGEFRQE